MVHHEPTSPVIDKSVLWPTWGTKATGTLNDANTEDDMETTKRGSLLWAGVSLENMINSDDFDIEVKRYNGVAWLLYKKYVVTKIAGVIYTNTGAGAIGSNITQLNIENVYLDSTRKLRIKLTRNSGTDRDFPYFYNKWE